MEFDAEFRFHSLTFFSNAVKLKRVKERIDGRPFFSEFELFEALCRRKRYGCGVEIA